jgi:hypothetical protein
MQGYGLTVFAGTEIDTFQFEVLGVVRGSSPQQDIVWGLMDGGPLAEAGAVGGMSGSPVYLDGGRLLGAMAYGFSAAKKPYAGITPIGQMLPVLDQAGNRDTSEGGPQDTGFGVPRSGRTGEGGPVDQADADGSLEWMRDVLALAAPPARITVPAAGIRLEPLATPLMVSGMGSETFAMMSPVLSEMGYMPLQAGGTSTTQSASPRLEPGAMVGVQLIRGDWNIHSYGTVTHRDGDRLVAFGHPMFWSGQTEWPMITVDVHFIVANLLRSFKFGSVIETVGTVTQDRASAIAGIVGPSPSMLAVAIDVDGGDESRSFRYEVVRDKAWTAVATLFSVIGSISSAGKMSGDHTVGLKARIDVAGGQQVTEQTLFSGPSAPFQAAAAVSRIVSVLLDNRFERPRLDKINIQLVLEERNREAVIEGVRLSRGAVRPGALIDVAVLVRPMHGDLKRHTVTLQIPESTPDGRLDLRVTDARATRLLKKKRAPGSGRPRTMAQLLDVLETSPANNEITVDLLLRRPGVTIGSIELASVPGSMLSVVRSSRHSGETMFTQGTVLATQTLVTDYVVSGQRQLPITVDRRAK